MRPPSRRPPSQRPPSRRPAPLRLGLALLLALAAAASGWAQARPLSAEARATLGIDSEAEAARYAEGRAQALAFRLDAARATFRDLAATGSLAGVYGLETTALWRALMTEDDDHYDRFYALNDSLTALAGRVPEAEGGTVYVAIAKLHRALAMGRQERYVRAGTSFKDACGRYRDLAAAPTPSPDALFGQGVCEVAAGAVPRQYRWLARLFGFRGSVASGLAKLEAAAEGDGAFAVEATIGLAISDATLNERRAGSVDRLAALAEDHPDSPPLAYLAGYHLDLDRRAPEAEAAFRRALAAMESDEVQPMPTVRGHLGLVLFRQDAFDEAVPLLEDYVRTFRGRALKATAQLYAGLGREMLGDRRRAEAHYRRVRAARDYDADLSAAREAETLLEAPMTEADRALLLGRNAFDSGRYREAITQLQPVLTNRDLAEDDRAEAAYRSGRAYQALDEAAEALRHFQLAIDRPGDPLAKWGPWSLYHAGEVHEAEGDAGAARERYARVLDNEAEFDYHKSLEQRTRAALERIGR
ncbi:MAG: hypothetical protein AAF594_16005 [Bacteroidota bacterium]